MPEQPETIGQVSDTTDSEPSDHKSASDERLSDPELSPDLQAPSEHQNETDTSDNTETADGAGPAQDVEQPETAEGSDLPDPGNRDTSTDAPDPTIQDAGDGMDPPSGDVPRPAAASAGEPVPERSWSDPARLPRPDELGILPPDGKYAIVQLDDNGQPDWSTVEYHDGSSRIDQLQSDRRIRHDHGDQAAEPPKPTGDELSGDAERTDLEDPQESKISRLVDRQFRSSDEAHEAAEEWGDKVQRLFDPPPTGQAETRQPQGEVVIYQRPEYQVDGGDVGSMIATVGLLAGALYVKLSNKRSQ